MTFRQTFVTKCIVPDAPPGPVGPEVEGAPEIAIAGRAGRAAIQIGDNRDVVGVLTSAPSLLYLEISLREAEVRYANSDFDGALDQLIWLGFLLLSSKLRRSARESIHDAGLVEEVVESFAEFDAIRRKVFVLMRRLSLGLDYWGNTRDFVPLLSRNYYSDVIDKLLEHAKRIEDLAIKYRDARDDWTTARTQLSLAVSSQEGFLTTLDDQLLKLAEIERNLVVDIEELANAYDHSWRQVLDAGEAFKRAVERESGGCDFKAVLTAVAAIATAVGTMGTGAAVAVAAWQAYNQFDKKKDDPEDRLGELGETKYKLEKIAGVGKGVAEVAKGIDQIRDVLDRPNVKLPDLPNDAAKLIMSRDDLQKTVEPFRHLPEATEYLARVDEFIELVTTRNNKIVEYNLLANSRSEIDANIDKGRAEIVRLRTDINKPNVRHLPEFTNFMSCANLANKKTIINMLYKEHRAFEYWSGQKVPFRVDRDSIDHLSITHQTTKERLVAAMENRGRELESLKFVDKAARFSFTRDVSSERLDAFKATGRVIFALPYARFSHMALVRVTRVQLRLPGIALRSTKRGEDPLLLRLKHYGQARLQTAEGRFVEFSHEPRLTAIFYHVSSEVTRPFHLGGSDDYIKLTPDGPWALSLDDDEMERVDLSALGDIEIEFEGEFLTRR